MPGGVNAPRKGRRPGSKNRAPYPRRLIPSDRRNVDIKAVYVPYLNTPNRGRLFIEWRGQRHPFPADKIGNYVFAPKVFAGKFPHGRKIWPLGVLLWVDTQQVQIDEGEHAVKGRPKRLVGWFPKGTRPPGG